MRGLIESAAAEYRRYKSLADRAMAQLSDAELCRPGPNGGNSIVTICWHISGNLESRFTDFLTSDGEKPWRNRAEEFRPREATRTELQTRWEAAWGVLFQALGTLGEDQAEQPVVIRGESMPVHAALFRSVAHTAYHVGQIVTLAHAIRGADWKFLNPH